MTKIALLLSVIHKQFYLHIGCFAFLYFNKGKRSKNKSYKQKCHFATMCLSQRNAPLAMNFSGLLQTSPGRKMTLDSKCNLFLLNVPVARFLTTNLMLYISYSDI